MSKYDVVTLGELLIDFTENGTSGQGNPVYEANPGGAPCNVLAMLTKLGKHIAGRTAGIRLIDRVPLSAGAILRKIDQ